MTAPLTRSAFDALSPRDRMEHVQAGGVVTDDLPGQPVKLMPGDMRRSDFDALDPAAKREAARRHRIVDAPDAPATPAAPPTGFRWATDGIGLVRHE